VSLPVHAAMVPSRASSGFYSNRYALGLRSALSFSYIPKLLEMAGEHNIALRVVGLGIEKPAAIRRDRQAARG